MNDKQTRTPIIDPILLALKSRRVIVALASLLVGVMMVTVPDLHPVKNELLVLLITLSLAVIGGYSVEDAAMAANNSTVNEEDLRDLLWDVVDSILDEVTGRE